MDLLSRNIQRGSRTADVYNHVQARLDRVCEPDGELEMYLDTVG